MTHFTDDELRDWAEAAPAAGDRARLTAHIAACAGCASRYAAAIRERSRTTDEVDEADVKAFAEAAYGIPVVERSGTWRRWAVGLAAAAALVVAIAVPYALRNRGDERAAFRGGAVHALTPAGAIPVGTAFAWSSDGTYARFRVDIGDSTGVIDSEETAASPLRLQPQAWAKLRPGIDYWWTVTALDADGREAASSPRQAFTLQPR